MNDTPTNRSSWFRFSLRTLLLLVAAVAVGSWAYWTGWPWWQAYLEQSRFEQSIQKIKAGMTESQILVLIPEWTASWLTTDRKGVMSFLVYTAHLKSTVYFIILRLPQGAHGNTSDGQFDGVQVFRVSPVPKDYPYSADREDYDHYMVYREKLLDIFIRGGTNLNGIKYELIYSDPPPKRDSDSK